MSKKLLSYITLLIISIFIILFVSKDNNWYHLALDGYKKFNKWVDIAWGVTLTYLVDFSDYEKTFENQTQLSEAKKFVRSIIEKQIDARISSLWVSDYTASFKQMNWQEYIEVVIWWVSDVSYAKELIWKTTKLDFMLPFDGKLTDEIKNDRQQKAESILHAVVASGSQAFSYINPDENIVYFSWSLTAQEYASLVTIPVDQLSWSIGNWFHAKLLEGKFKEVDGWSILSTRAYNSEKSTYDIELIFIAHAPKWQLAVDPKTGEIMNGAYMLQALVEKSNLWQPWVRIDFSGKWKEIWCNITRDNVWKQIAIFVGWKNVSDPVINEAICGWSTMISFWAGGYDASIQQWKALVEELSYTLPVPLVLSFEEKISPLLWDNAIRWALYAAVAWYIAILCLMYYMYGVSRAINAWVALLAYLIVLFALIKILGHSLSLSGIAAILLNIWMAVDANILIYERLREELASGKEMHHAINEWYTRSFVAIKDGNLTTAFMWLLLFIIWTNVFKGFGTMMVVNIILTLIFLVPLTKETLLFMADRRLLTK